jgi:hypothetical protein
MPFGLADKTEQAFFLRYDRLAVSVPRWPACHYRRPSSGLAIMASNGYDGVGGGNCRTVLPPVRYPSHNGHLRIGAGEIASYCGRAARILSAFARRRRKPARIVAVRLQSSQDNAASHAASQAEWHRILLASDQHAAVPAVRAKAMAGRGFARLTTEEAGAALEGARGRETVLPVERKVRREGEGGG